MQKTKKIEIFEGKPPIYFRPGTSDELIIKEILIDQKSYLFPKMNPRMIFDIGANIGITTILLANLYPEATIYAFEPEKENFEMLTLNTSKYQQQVVTFQCGLGKKTERKKIFKSDDPTNLGGFSLHIPAEVGAEVNIVKTADVVEQFGAPDIIKIDCEGAEYEILFGFPGLDKVKWIAGELHSVNDYETLCLLGKNFKIATARDFDSKVWSFHALNKTITDFSFSSLPQD